MKTLITGGTGYIG